MSKLRIPDPFGPTKLDGIKAAAGRGDWRAALLAAARFPDLGEHRGAILSAREALERPGFQRQLGRQPEALVEAGIAALKARYRL